MFEKQLLVFVRGPRWSIQIHCRHSNQSLSNTQLKVLNQMFQKHLDFLQGCEAIENAIVQVLRIERRIQVSVLTLALNEMLTILSVKE